jgi:hypothetical protein
MIEGRVLRKRGRQENVVVSCGLLFVVVSHSQPGEKL